MTQPWDHLDFTPISRPPARPPSRITLSDWMMVILCCALGLAFATVVTLPRVFAAIYATSLLLVPALALGQWTIQRRTAPLTLGEWAGVVPILAPFGSFLFALLVQDMWGFWWFWSLFQCGFGVIALVRLGARWIDPPTMRCQGWLDTLGCFICLGHAALVTLAVWHNMM